MSLSQFALPAELWDSIIDHLHDDLAALLVCALVCRMWVPASRFHAFSSLALSQKAPQRAARLDTLLASPHGTIAAAVWSLDFPDALAPIQVRTPMLHVKPLLALVPRAATLPHVRALSLSDLPWALLTCFRDIERLTLSRLCAGGCLLAVTAALPHLTHLTLDGVATVPYRGLPPIGDGASTPLTQLGTLTVRSSPLAVLGWLALCTAARILEVDVFCASDVHDLAAYLAARGEALHTLDLAFAGAPLDESLLPLLLAPCPDLPLLRLRFDSASAARAFFPLQGAFLVRQPDWSRELAREFQHPPAMERAPLTIEIIVPCADVDPEHFSADLIRASTRGDVTVHVRASSTSP
ncbi:hypothetical protein FB451DRAFT_665243 [Mycena latifolia]|nr:hypothetical protein FB451DRAFT_665243 [Mycena latifolia]